MKKRSVNVELPEEVWKVIDTHIKSKGETDSETLCKLIKKYLAENAYESDLYILKNGNGIKDDVDLHDDMIRSIIELLESKGICTFQEWAQIMNKRIIKF
jgi:hypothetical protein